MPPFPPPPFKIIWMNIPAQNVLLRKTLLELAGQVTYRVNKKGLEVLCLWPEFQGPGNLPFQDFVDRINVIQVWPFREQQLSPAGKQPLWRSTWHSEPIKGFKNMISTCHSTEYHLGPYLLVPENEGITKSYRYVKTTTTNSLRQKAKQFNAFQKADLNIKA